MGFWSTVLVALRFRSSEVTVVTDPLHTRRIQLDAVLQRVRIDGAAVQKIRSDALSVHRLRLEAR